MRKKLTVLILLFVSFAYPQTATMMELIASLDDSVRRKSTAGIFLSDTDKFNSKDVFDLRRSIFSAGYSPSLHSVVIPSGENAVVKGFLGFPIMYNAMYLGLSAAYEMNETRKDYADNLAGFLGKKVVTGSTFAVRAVFKFNYMIAVHYLIARGGTKTFNEGYSSFQDLKNNTVITNSEDNSVWIHELSFGLRLGDMKLQIPLILSITNNGYIKNYGRQISEIAIVDATPYYYNNSEIVSGSTNAIDSSINLALSPEFYMPLSAGPLSGMTFGLRLGFDVYNPANKSVSYTNTAITETVATGTTISSNETITTVEKNGIFNMNLDINVSPALEWSLSEGKVLLIMEPKLGLKINFTNIGNVSANVKTQLITAGYGNPPFYSERNVMDGNKCFKVAAMPYLELPMGTVFTPVNWFEFRAGISYRLGFNMYSDSYEDITGVKYKIFNYNFESEMNLFTGMGFIVANDFLIDFFLSARTKSDDSNTMAEKTIFGIDSWGVQLSFRFY